MQSGSQPDLRRPFMLPWLVKFLGDFCEKWKFLIKELSLFLQHMSLTNGQ